MNIVLKIWRQRSAEAEGKFVRYEVEGADPRGSLLGALDVQSTISGAFSEADVAVLQTMADQIAVAIQNALLYEESLRRFAEIEATNRESTRHAWQEFIHDQRATLEVKAQSQLDFARLRSLTSRSNRQHHSR